MSIQNCGNEKLFTTYIECAGGSFMFISLVDTTDWLVFSTGLVKAFES